jgi:hypothetical protein
MRTRLRLKLAFSHIILFLLPSLLFPTSLKEIGNDRNWRMLLEFDASEDVSRITDHAFYATGYPTTPEMEAGYLIEQMNDDLIGRFPARYDYLRRTYGIAVDVAENKSVKDFLKDKGNLHRFFHAVYREHRKLFRT